MDPQTLLIYMLLSDRRGFDWGSLFNFLSPLEQAAINRWLPAGTIGGGYAVPPRAVNFPIIGGGGIVVPPPAR